MIAANIMTKDVVKFGPGHTIREVVKVSLEQRVRLIPVVDSDDKVLGVITPRSLMKALLPRYISEGLLDDVAFAPDLPQFVDSIDAMGSKSIMECLEKDFVCVPPSTSSMELAALFVNPKKMAESILVVDDKKRVLGVVSPWDLFRRLWEFARERGQ